MSSDEITSMWRAPPSPRHSIQASSGKAASGKTKKRQEQNRNAQRLYRQRKAQYVQGLLSHIDQINRTHTSLQNSCKALCQEIAGLQGQVEALKEQLEFWSRVEIVLLKTPQDDQAIASKRTGMGSGATGFAENYPPYPNFDYYIGS
ncbi:hypothetical protein BJY01DRAFT_248382 [Aspergillus pseudoustus]|uniref:BZIP domain-containing protein n=1 Tax=Aspergillus pseudoustus TaxID=1810923 RepID=A0ABR4JVA5_9EURO